MSYTGSFLKDKFDGEGDFTQKIRGKSNSFISINFAKEKFIIDLRIDQIKFNITLICLIFVIRGSI